MGVAGDASAMEGPGCPPHTDNPGRVTRPGARKLSTEMAGPTRLELATSGVTGRRSNQLNYDPARVSCDPELPAVTPRE